MIRIRPWLTTVTALAGSLLSIGSSGSILSIGSAGSILCIGYAGSVLSIGSTVASPGALVLTHFEQGYII
jgi:hypothetical protein